MTTNQDTMSKRIFQDWMAQTEPIPLFDAHVSTWMRESSVNATQHLKKQQTQAESDITPDEQKYRDTWAKLEAVEKLELDRQKVESWTVNSKQEMDEREAEIKRIDTAINLLLKPLESTQKASSLHNDSCGPAPLTTGDIAHSFDGLRWSESQWKKPLGDRPKWLSACVAIPGQRGVSETRWNPVLIGAALYQLGHVSARSIRARFQTVHTLKPWLDAWKTYEADYCDNE